MPITRERFESGMTYAEYKAQMTQNRDRLEVNEHQLQIHPDDLEVFRGLKRTLKVLVLAEDWCGDVIANLPILGRLAAESGKLEVRVFLRDNNLDLMDQYLKQGRFRSIPTFVFFDEDFNEIGVFSERPDSVTALREKKQRELYAQNPEFGSPNTPISQLPEDVRQRLSQAMAALREELVAISNGEVVRELRQIVERV